MKIDVFINLKWLVKMFEVKPEKNYAIAVIDNAPPSQPQLPLIGKNFLWIRKVEAIPTRRKELEKLFSSYGIRVEKEQPIAVFHHHDFREPYFQSEEEVEFYEFSHTGSIAYTAFCHADATLLSHMLSGTFHRYDKVILVKANFSEAEIAELQSRHWISREFKKLEGVGEEESLIFSIALQLTGGRIVPDPRRYRPEVHDELIKAGIPMDQYAIPALFKEVEIQTETNLDAEVAKRMREKQTNWQKELERLKREAELARAVQAREKELREQGELLPEDARKYVDSIAPSLGCDYTDQPVYPPTRKDIAAVRRSVENGSSYGYDIIYLVWRVGNEIRAKRLIDSVPTKDYIHIRSLTETKNGIKVEVGSGGNYSGKPWDKVIEVAFVELSGAGSGKALGELERLSAGTKEQFSFLPKAAQPYNMALAEQMARYEMAAAGKKNRGEEKLESEYSELLKKLKKKHSNLSEVFRLAVIAEVYDDKVVRETFGLLELTEDDSIANMALHILGEMAMMRNNPSLYLRFVDLLKKSTDPERERILLDDRFEFQTDEIIESAMKEYET